jgi:hypothetical protein
MGIIVEQIEIYEPRNPRKTHYFQCVETHFEDLEMVWDDRFQRQYGFSKHYVRENIRKYRS